MKIAAAAALVLALLGLPATPASAHADYLSSTPAPCSAAASDEVAAIVFTEELDPEQIDVTVIAATGAVAADGVLDLDDLSRTRVLLEPPRALEPGRYRVEWQVRSAADGDTTVGGFGFAVGSSTTAAEDCAVDERTLDDLDEDGSGGIPALAVVILALLSLAVVAAGVLLVLPRARGAES